MPIIYKILVPVDGSEPSNRGLDYAKDMAKKFNAEITALHVYELTGKEYNVIFDGHLKKYAQDILDKSVNQIFTPESSITGLMLAGNTYTAEKNNFDLIIMGSRGLGTIKGFLLGSTSNFVLHHSKLPVLVVH